MTVESAIFQWAKYCVTATNSESKTVSYDRQYDSLIKIAHSWFVLQSSSDWFDTRIECDSISLSIELEMTDF